MLSVYTKNATIVGHFGFVFEENSHVYWDHSRPQSPQKDRGLWGRECIVPSLWGKALSPDKNEKRAFSYFSGLKSFFEKLRNSDGRPNRRNKAVFSNNRRSVDVRLNRAP